MKIAVVQKCPSNINYEKSLQLSPLHVFNMSSQKVTRLLKRDVDLVDFDPNDFDWVILVGSEAVKQYSKVTSVSDYTGKILPGKNGEENLIACISPGMLAFKPEHRPVFEETVASIHKIVSGKNEEEKELDIKFITEEAEALEYLTDVLKNTTGTVSLDSETSSLHNRQGYILGISISHKERQGVYIDSMLFDGQVLDLFREIIETRPVVFHNAKFDMKFFTYI